MFACVGAVQALISFASPLYNLIYIATYVWHSGFVYCVSALILIIMIFLSLYSYVYMKRNEKKMKEKTDTVIMPDESDNIVTGKEQVY